MKAMKTIVKKDLGYTLTCYSTHELESEIELSALNRETENLLKECIHCGNGGTEVTHIFHPDWGSPHELYAKCPKCGIRTQEWHAEDTEEDFKEALRLIVEAWNKRPE